MQGGGVGRVKSHGAGHKDYNLLTEVAVMDAGGQLSNKTPDLLQFAVTVCDVIEACCDLFHSENSRFCFRCSGNHVLHSWNYLYKLEIIYYSTIVI
jgi:hypothetical protein